MLCFEVEHGRVLMLSVERVLVEGHELLLLLRRVLVQDIHIVLLVENSLLVLLLLLLQDELFLPTLWREGWRFD